MVVHSSLFVPMSTTTKSFLCYYKMMYVGAGHFIHSLIGYMMQHFDVDWKRKLFLKY